MARTGAPGPGSRQPRASRPRRAAADPARLAALDVLRAVAERDAYANLLLPRLLRERGLSGRDAGLATELTYGTLRGLGSYDAILAICSDRDLDRIDPPLRAVLRLGSHQLLATRVRPHAAVATSVDLARQVAGSRPAGFVNAVLRRVATQDLAAWLDIASPDRVADPIGHLSVRYSHPRWIVSALAEALGEEPGTGMPGTEALLAADGEPPRVTLCALPGLADRQELAGEGREPGRWSPFSMYLGHGDPGEIAAVAEQRVTVCDEASQLAALALARAFPGGGEARAGGAGDVPGIERPSAGERWLDLCAGPGGKARLLAALAAGSGARLLAADLRPHRAGLVRAGLVRAGLVRAGLGGADPVSAAAQAMIGETFSLIAPQSLPDHAGAGPRVAGSAAAPESGAWVVVADGTVPAWRAGSFDRVLADVPCSGLGALRRRPEARWRRSPEDVAALVPLQRALLASALDAARPGGVVAYVTCSPHLAETRDVVTGVLRGRRDVEVLDAPAVLPEVSGLRCPEPHGSFAQFWPHRHGTDAIFLALLRRLG